MSIQPPLMRRLVQAKQILLHAMDHAGRPGELNRLFAILAFDQAIEHFLNTIVLELEGKISERNFFELLKAANEALAASQKGPLSGAKRIGTVHLMRNNSQHHGMIPSHEDLSRAKVYSEDFLRDSYSACFSIGFDEVFLADAIEFEDVKQHFREVEEALAKDDPKKSMEELGICFCLIESHFLAEDYEFRWDLDDSFVRSLSRVLSRIPDSSSEARQVEVQVGRFIGGVKHELEYLSNRVMVLSVGGNVPDYQFFRQIAPRVGRTADGAFHVFHHGEPSKEDCLRAFNFVYNTVLAVQGLPSAES